MAHNIVQLSLDGDRDLRLETIRCPLYDTQYQATPSRADYKNRKGMCFPPVPFFYGEPLGTELRYTNCIMRGQLPWPKRFFCTEVQFFMERDPGPSILKELVLKLQVGERWYFQQPITAMTPMEVPTWQNRGDFTLGWRSPITTEVDLDGVGLPDWEPPKLSIYIPPVQSFRCELETGGMPILDSELRVVLDGILLREIQ